MLTVPGTACPCAQAVGAQSLTTSSVQTGQLAAALSRPPAAFPSQHAHIATQPGAPHLWCPWPFDQVRIQYLLPPVQTLRIGAPIKVLGDAHPVLAIVFLHSMAEQSVLSSTPSVRATGGAHAPGFTHLLRCPSCLRLTFLHDRLDGSRVVHGSQRCVEQFSRGDAATPNVTLKV